MTMYERIQMLCQNSGFEISNIGKKIPGTSVSKGTISKWKSGVVPRAGTLKAIADYFGVSVEYLLGRTEQKEKSAELDEQYSSTLSELPDNIFPIKTKRIPLLGEIACGEPIFANEEYGEYIMTSEEVDADLCLRAKGDSMTGARIFDGDIVFIRKQDAVDNGEIAAVIIGDEATLKRVYYFPNENKLVLNAENAAYAPLMYVGDELDSVRILGRAVAFQSLVR